VERQFVSAIDVLVGIDWLAPSRVEDWQQGRVEYLEEMTQANLAKLAAAMRLFRTWAPGRGADSERNRLRRTVHGPRPMSPIGETPPRERPRRLDPASDPIHLITERRRRWVPGE
jgi:hypothetical protein